MNPVDIEVAVHHKLALWLCPECVGSLPANPSDSSWCDCILERSGENLTELNIGSEAPDFESVDQNGNKVRLSGFRGKTVVLYFYPKDNTPGCTAEACSFRDDMDSIAEAGIKVLGVSADGVDSHKKFEKKHGLNFTLVADPGRDIIDMYGVRGTFGAAHRVTFLIDHDGRIRHIWPRVRPRGHSAEVLEKVKELGL
jgi:peroxiredoxin Q/BCP